MSADKYANNTSTNTHDYDGLLKDPYRKYIIDDDDELESAISFEETLNEIDLFVTKMDNSNEHKASVLTTIALLRRDRGQNYDDRNDINIEDLLPRTWRFIKYYDELGIQCFLEQMIEISTSGPCAQGRIARVFQFYEYHMIEKDEIYDNCRLNNTDCEIIYTRY